MIRASFFAWSAAILFTAGIMNAQVAGRVTGTVQDSSGAAVPNASVSLQLPGSGASVYSTVTTAAGDFTIVTVNPAIYDLVVEAKGLLKSVVSGLNVDPGRSTDVPPVKLDVAGLTQAVEVSAATQTVETSNAEITTTIATSQIQNLPTLNRSPLAFLQTQVGINNARGATTINGQRPSYVNVTLDGINIQDNFIRTNDLDFLPNLLLLDQVAEVTISSSNANLASYGGSSQVQFVSPSGTNQFHGNVYWSNRNNYFAANTWFNNQAGVKNAFLNQNQIGGSLGGHIIKNKLFFYTNYEAFRLRQQTSQDPTILTQDARNGIFTYRDSGGAVQKVNILQAMGIQTDSAAAAILAQVPSADHINNFNTGDSTATLLRNSAGYQFVKRNNRTRDNVTFKSDYLPSTRHSFTVSYIFNRDILDRPDLDTTFNLIPSIANNDPTKLLSSSWRWNLKPNLTNEVRFGFNWAPSLFLASQKIPQYFVTGTLYTNPVNTFRTQGRNTDSYNIADNANWVHDSHTVSFGFQMQRVRVEQYNDAGITPTYALGIGTGNQGLTAAQLPGISASDLASANSLLATLGGYFTSDTQTFNVSSRTSGFVNNFTNLRHDKFDNYAFYGQDAWKVSHRVTATLGLRWDYYTPVDERDALALFPVLQNNNVIQTVMNPNAVLDFAGSAVGRPWYKSDKNNFAPSAGLAWDVFGNGKTALRGGYSIFYVNDNTIRATDNSQLTNTGLQSIVAKSGLGGRLNAGVPAIPPPAYKVPRTLADNYALNSGSAVAMPDPGLVTPYVQEWNIGIQQSVKGTIVDLRYVGNHGAKEIRGFDYNQVLINAIMPDFLRAQSNGLLAQKATGSFVPTFNANIPGSQPLPFFAQLPSGGLLTNSTVISDIQTGQVGELGSLYQTNGLNGPVNFFANPNVLGANVLTNYSNSTYHALQIDVTHRFAHDFQLQGNYVFSRLLSDAAGNQQTDFEPFLDINNAKIERSRPADYDITHVFKANGYYELPFGPGKRFASENPVLSRVIGGWNVASIFTRQSGTPFSVLSGRGTLNRAARSANNTVNTTLDKSQLDQIFQLTMTGNGPVFVPASVKGTDNRAVAPDGAAPFTGQVFFEPAAGALGSLQRNYFSGPWVWDMDFKISKITRIKERHQIELRMDATNVFNHPTFFVGDQTVTSTTFGKITANYYGRRLVQFALYYRF
jgi:Carboxypeptidase regulatory-like domain/TonB dependent receptor